MQDALLYATSNEMQKRDAAAALAALLPGMKWDKNERILDIGSGCGDVTVNLLSKRVPVSHQIIGIDCSSEMVDFANEHHSCQNIKFQCQDIQEDKDVQKCFEKRFTKIFSFYCLHWVKDLKQSMENIDKLLDDQGEVVLLFLASNPLFSMYKILAENSRWTKYMLDYDKYVPVYQNCSNPKAEFTKIINQVGFEIQFLEVNEHSFWYDNKNQLVKAVKATNPFIQRIPEEEVTAYLMESLTTLLSLDVPIKNNKIEARYNLMVTHLKKKNK